MTGNAAQPLFAGIAYLNSAPYFSPWRLGAVSVPFPYALMEPAGVNRAVAEGRAFGGLMSAAAFARTPGLVRVPGFEIACDGPVRSILVVTRGGWESVRRVFVTTASASSVALLERLFASDGISPVLIPADDPLDRIEAETDAALVIGDAALALETAAWHCRDLGAWWRDLTGLPMIFAVTAVRADETGRIPALHRALSDSLEWSAAHVDEVIAEWYDRAGRSSSGASRTAVPVPADARGYLGTFASARGHARIEEGLAAFISSLGGRPPDGVPRSGRSPEGS